ncbi:hypothetical protein PMAYCL1PPCAC_10279, partial [Pristionchus mayeri]
QTLHDPEVGLQVLMCAIADFANLHCVRVHSFAVQPVAWRSSFLIPWQEGQPQLALRHRFECSISSIHSLLCFVAWRVDGGQDDEGSCSDCRCHARSRGHRSHYSRFLHFLIRSLPSEFSSSTSARQPRQQCSYFHRYHHCLILPLPLAFSSRTSGLLQA